MNGVNSLSGYSTTDIETELKRREYASYVGTWFEAYWHSTHQTWGVRLRPKYAHKKRGL